MRGNSRFVRENRKETDSVCAELLVSFLCRRYMEKKPGLGKTCNALG